MNLPFLLLQQLLSINSLLIHSIIFGIHRHSSILPKHKRQKVIRTQRTYNHYGLKICIFLKTVNFELGPKPRKDVRIQGRNAKVDGNGRIGTLQRSSKLERAGRSRVWGLKYKRGITPACPCKYFYLCVCVCVCAHMHTHMWQMLIESRRGCWISCGGSQM